MKSPFAIFRKHQKVLMVVLTGLAMFAFVVLDSLTQNIGAFPPIFGALLGIGVIWWLFFSGKKQEPAHSHKTASFSRKYSWVLMLLGAAGGWMLGSYFQSSIGVQAAVKTSFGEVTEDDLRQVITRRQIADEFLTRAFYAAHEGEKFPPVNILRSYKFNIGGDPRMEALMHILLMREAKKINLDVTNDQIIDLINAVTSDKLTTNAFKKILSDLRLSDAELMTLLGEQMVSREMRNLLMPRHLATPEDYWDAFQKLNVLEELSAVPIAVESFLAEVPEPAEEELLEFFNENKEKAPGEEGPASFGFRQPGRIRLAYLEIDYDTVEKEVPQVSDEDVEKYYAEHKEEFRNQVAPAFPDVDNPEMKAPQQKETSTPPGPALNLPKQETTKPEQDKKGKQTPETKTPAEKKPADPSKTDKTDKKPVEKPAEKPTPPAKKPPAKSGEKVETPPKKPEKKAPENEKQSSVERDLSAAFFASVKDEKPEQKKEEAKKTTEEKPASKKPEAKSPKPDTKKVETPEPTEKPSPATQKKTTPAKQGEKKEKTDKKSKPEKPAEPGDKSKPTGDSKEKMPQLPTPAPAKPLPEFKPLDDELKEQIRAQILDTRVRERMKEIATQARGHMLKVNGAYAIAENAEAKEKAAQQIQEEAKKYAREHHLRYVETPFLSYSELEESEDYPVGSSTEPAANVFERSNLRTVPQMHFNVRDLESLERQRYHLFDAEDRSTLNRFIHWQIAFKPSHVPKWDEQGVKEQVTKAWKMKQARELAEKRAGEVVELLKKSDKPWAEALAGQLETGKEGSASLNVGHTERRFSWLTRSTAPNPNPFMPPPMELTQIPIIFDGVDDNFMRTVFRKLDNQETGSVWGAEKRYIYVVRPENRSDIETVREDFLAQRDQIFSPRSPYTMLIYSNARNVIRRWNDEFFSKYDVKWLETEQQ